MDPVIIQISVLHMLLLTTVLTLLSMHLIVIASTLPQTINLNSSKGHGLTSIPGKLLVQNHVDVIRTSCGYEVLLVKTVLVKTEP